MTHPKLVETMSSPAFYPHRPEQVELIQTHISYVFIAGDFVYKVKKSVDFGFLDFTSLDKRKFYCNEELRLNRRLAPDIYLEVVEIYEDGNHNITLEKGEQVIEYAVKMKKLPHDKMLKELLSQGKVDYAVMDAIAHKLVDFHARAATGGKIDESGSIETIRQNHDENFSQTEPYINITIPEYRYRFIKSYVYGYIERHKPLLLKRIADHKIREGHGDLHLENICIMDDDIVIFDCIEFNELFRYDDVAAEVAFLAMDLDYNGYPDYSDVFVDDYISCANDSEIRLLLNFYKCYYAYVRGKVIGFEIKEEEVRQEEREEALRSAASYFDLAYTYASRLEKPALILMSGLMGTGKSVLARLISSRIGAEVIRTDVLRKEILDIPQTERRHEAFGRGIYSNDITRRTYEETLTLASAKLRAGKSVIIDASYKRREERKKVFEFAKKLNIDFFLIECICPEGIIKKRLDSRMAATGESSDGRWEIFQAQKDTFDPITEIPEESHIIIDTSLPPDEGMLKAIQAIKNLLTPC